ncbi:GHKL domain-containing protein [Clostridium perfringens]|nr:GHKL domain-containing protein [Clostridium perfringens]
MYVRNVIELFYVIYIFFIGIFSFFYLDKKIDLKKRVFSTIILNFLILLINYIFYINEFSYFFEALIIYIYYVYLYKKNMTSILMTSIYLLNLSLGKYILMLIYSVMIFDLEVLKIMNNIMFLCFMILLILMIIVVVFIVNFFKECILNINDLTIKKQTKLVFAIGISVLLSEKVFDNISLNASLVYRVNISTINIAVTLAIIHFITYKRFKEYKSNSQINILEKQLDYQKNYYEKVINNYGEARKALHDMNNHMSVIKYFLENKDYKNMDDYIKSLSERIVTNKNNNICSNKVINAICLDKCDRCKKEGINIRFDIIINKELNIDNLDLCIVLGNLIDNAIEACEKINDKDVQKFIQVSARIYLNQIYIKVINSKSNRVEKRNGKFLTSKRDKKNHGIGLENVKEAVHKNHGDIEIKDSKNTFEVSLYMKC